MVVNVKLSINFHVLEYNLEKYNNQPTCVMKVIKTGVQTLQRWPPSITIDKLKNVEKMNPNWKFDCLFELQ